MPRDPSKPILILGWLCVFIGAFLPVMMITAHLSRFVALLMPVAAALLILGLFMVAGRFPPQRDPS